MNYGSHVKLLKEGIPFRGCMSSLESGLIAAGLASGAAIWTWRNPEANTRALALSFVRILTTTVTAFTTAITAGRGLVLVRLTPDAPGTANPSGGTAFTPVKLNSGSSESVGVGQVATTGALSITGFTASAAMRRRDMALNGNANNQGQEFWFANNPHEEPMILQPGQAAAIVASQLFDAAGTFRLSVDFTGVELP